MSPGSTSPSRFSPCCRILTLTLLNGDVSVIYSDLLIYSHPVIYTDLLIYSHPVIYTDLLIYSDSVIYSHSVIYSNSLIYSDSVIYSNSLIYSDSVIYTSCLPCLADAHVMLVQRMIGSKLGTGGSSGYHYLRSTVR